MPTETQTQILAAMTNAIFHSEYADRHEVTISDARELAAAALGADPR